ncbi:MAG: tetratricopeptide repeat protein [Pseudomonas sp.]
MKAVATLKDEARKSEQAEQWEQAIHAYDEVLRITETARAELPLYNRVGDLYVRLGKPQDAVPYYEKASDYYAEAGLYNNAIALCNKARRCAPERLDLLRKLGQLSAVQGFQVDARRWFLEYAERQIETGNLKHVFAALEDVTSAGEDAEIRVLLGRQLRAHQQTVPAVAVLTRAHALYVQAGDKASADALRAEILELAPDAFNKEGADASTSSAPVASHIPDRPGFIDYEVSKSPRLDRPSAYAAPPPTRAPNAPGVADLEFETAGGLFSHPPRSSFEPKHQVVQPAPDPVLAAVDPAVEADDQAARAIDRVFDLSDEQDQAAVQSSGGAVQVDRVHESEPLSAPDMPRAVLKLGSVDDDDAGDPGAPVELRGLFPLELEDALPPAPGTLQLDLPPSWFGTGPEETPEEAEHADSAVDTERAADAAGPALARSSSDGPPVREGVETAQPPATSAGFVDLADLLGYDGAADANTRFLVAQVPTGDEDRDFADLLSQFKKKVAESLSVDDTDAHYDLGLAYKEMGLIDEAISEFQTAMKGGSSRLKVFEELGNCFLLKNQFSVAVNVLNRAAQQKVDDEASLVGVYYALARAYEGLGQTAQARTAYEQVIALDINFQDATQRLASL